jgi:hypothetical protein
MIPKTKLVMQTLFQVDLLEESEKLCKDKYTLLREQEIALP